MSKRQSAVIPNIVRNLLFWIGATLAILTLALYWQVSDFEFINFDDDLYVQANPAVQAGLRPETMKWAFTTRHAANWHPLTWISLMVDTDLAKIATWITDAPFGRQNSGFYHLTNALLHAANVVLLFLVLSIMTGRRWPSAFVAALFAVHPLHVESVAWVAERKDVLSTLFWLLTMLAYVRHVQSPGVKSRLWVIVLFALGLMAKPMLVTLPIALILLHIWPLNRGRGLGDRGQGGNAPAPGHEVSSPTPDPRPPTPCFRGSLAPLFILALISCGLTLWAQGSGGAMGDALTYPFGVRLANAAVACVAYLWKMVWPTGLSILYLHPGRGLPAWQVIGSALGLAAMTFTAVRAARSRPYVTVGWFWYLITLVPVIGLVQVGKQAMADRYTYVPLIGIFIIIAWGLPDLLGTSRLGRARPGYVLAVLACAWIAALSVSAHREIGCWHDSITIFTKALQVDPTNALAFNNIGNAQLDGGDYDLAIANYHKALKHQPGYIDAQYNLAEALRQQGSVDASIAAYESLLRAYPDHKRAHNNLGAIFATQGRFRDAAKHFEAALRLDPTDESTRTNLENLRRQMGSSP